MKGLTLYCTPKPVGSDLQIYVDDDGNRYIRTRYVSTRRTDSTSAWYFRRVDFTDDGAMLLDRSLTHEANVTIAQPKPGRSALDVMPKSFA